MNRKPFGINAWGAVNVGIGHEPVKTGGHVVFATLKRTDGMGDQLWADARAMFGAKRAKFVQHFLVKNMRAGGSGSNVASGWVGHRCMVARACHIDAPAKDNALSPPLMFGREHADVRQQT